MIRLLPLALLRALLLAAAGSLLLLAALRTAAPDPSYALAGRGADRQTLTALRATLGSDRPLLVHWAELTGGIARGDLGRSLVDRQPVERVLARTLPLTLALVLPGWLLGHAIAIAFSLLRRANTVLYGVAFVSLSCGLVASVVLIQWLLCSPDGLNLLPAYGLPLDRFGDYLWHLLAPTLALAMAAFGGHWSCYRALLDDPLRPMRERAASARGRAPGSHYWHERLRPALPLVLNRIAYSAPLLLLGGSLVLESAFGVPGFGRRLVDAALANDWSLLVPVLTLATFAFALWTALIDLIGAWLDPRRQPHA